MPQIIVRMAPSLLSTRKPFICPICRCTFLSLDRKQRHVKRHKLKYKLRKSSAERKTHNLHSHGTDHIHLLQSYTSDFASHDLQLLNHQYQYCQQVLKEADTSKTRSRTKTKEKPFKCKLCQKSYSSRPALGFHIRYYHADPNDKPSCPFCQKRYASKTALKYHIASFHTKVKPLKCDFCEKRFIQTCHLKNHIYTHTKEKRFLCLCCGERFSSKFEWHCHVATHANSNVAQDFVLQSEALANHIQVSPRSQNELLLNQVNVNQQVLPVSGELEDGRSEKRPEDAVQSVSICDQDFSSGRKMLENYASSKNLNELLPQNNSKVGEESVMPGDVGENGSHQTRCEDLSHSQGDANQTLHGGVDQVVPQEKVLENDTSPNKCVKPFICKLCHKRCASKSTLVYHIKSVHLQIKPLKCDFCEKRFIQTTHLKVHTRTHTKEKPYPCTYCKKCFSTKKNLDQHLRVHLKPKKYQCNFCQEGFVRRSDLRLHIKAHKLQKKNLSQPELVQNGSDVAQALIQNNSKLNKSDEFVQTQGTSDPTFGQEVLAGDEMLANHAVGKGSNGALQTQGASDPTFEEEVLGGDDILVNDAVGKGGNRSLQTQGASDPTSKQGVLAGDESLVNHASAKGSNGSIQNQGASDLVFEEVLGGDEILVNNAIGKGGNRSLQIQGASDSTFEEVSAGDEMLVNDAGGKGSNGSLHIQGVAENIACQNRSEELSQSQGDTVNQNISLHGGDQVFPQVEVLENSTSPNVSGKPFRCQLCEKSYLSRSAFRSHVIGVHGNPSDKPTRQFCHKRFGSTTSLKYHVASFHTKVKPLKCDFCDKRFIQTCHLKVHMRTHTKEKPYPCMYCEKRFSTKPNLNAHLKVHFKPKLFQVSKNSTSPNVSGKPFRCKLCEKSYSSKSALSSHVSVFHGNPSDKPTCQFCQKRFASTTALKYHVASFHTKIKPLKCDFCDKRFIQTCHLKVHLRTHTKEKPFPCLYCEKRFSTKQNLIEHQQVHFKPKLFQCDFCQKGFTQRLDLELHIKAHELQSKTSSQPELVKNEGDVAERFIQKNSNQYQSDEFVPTQGVLEPTFEQEVSAGDEVLANPASAKGSNGSLQIQGAAENVACHRSEQLSQSQGDTVNQDVSLMHVGSDQVLPQVKGLENITSPNVSGKPYRCKLCEKSYSSRSSFRSHVIGVHGNPSDKPACQFCQKRFASTTALKYHVASFHTKIKPLKCDFCDKRFIQTSHLKVHMRTHTKETPFPCTYCEKRFSTKGGLNDHLQVHFKPKPFQCDLCQKGFTQRLELELHIKTHVQQNKTLSQRVLGQHEGDELQSKTLSQLVLVQNEGDGLQSKTSSQGVLVKNEGDVAEMLIQKNTNQNQPDELVPTQGASEPTFEQEVSAGDEMLINHAGGKGGNGSLQIQGEAENIACHNRSQQLSQRQGDTVNQDVSLQVGGDQVLPQVKVMENITSPNVSRKPYRCKLCEKSYSSRSSFRSHVIGVHGNPSDKPACQFCHKRFASTTALKYHVASLHTKVKPLKCDFCDKRFIQTSQFKVHMRTHTKETPFPCTYCEKRFSTKGGLNDHLQVHFKPKLFQCDFCQKGFTQHLELESHIKAHELQNKTLSQRVLVQNEGDELQKKTLSQHVLVKNGGDELQSKTLSQHVLVQNEGDELQSKTLSQCVLVQNEGADTQMLIQRNSNQNQSDDLGPTKGASDLTSEQEVSAGDEMLVNHAGGKEGNGSLQTQGAVENIACQNRREELSQSQRDTVNHNISLHGDGNQVLSQVKDLENSSSLNVSGEPFICKLCQKSYPSRSALSSHVSIFHGNPSDIPTCQFCHKRFASTKGLKYHIASFHTKIKPLKCDFCDKRFIQTCHLKVHMRTHTKEKPFPCRYCEKRFATIDSLNIHLLVHFKLNVKTHQARSNTLTQLALVQNDHNLAQVVMKNNPNQNQGASDPTLKQEVLAADEILANHACQKGSSGSLQVQCSNDQVLSEDRAIEDENSEGNDGHANREVFANQEILANRDTLASQEILANQDILPERGVLENAEGQNAELLQHRDVSQDAISKNRVSENDVSRKRNDDPSQILGKIHQEDSPVGGILRTNVSKHNTLLQNQQ